MKLAVLRTEAEVIAITGAWRELAQALPRSTPYSHPSWVLPWWRQRRALDLSWLCFAAYSDDGTLTGVLPLVRYPDGTIRYAGHDLHDIAEALTAPALTRELWRRAVEWLRGSGTPGVIDLPTLAPHDRDCLSTMGAQLRDTDLDPGAFVDLPPTWDEYLARLSANRRKHLRWERRTLERDHGTVTFRTTNERDDPTQDIEALWELRERSWTQRGRYDELADHVRGQPIRDFLHALAREAHTDIHGAQVARLMAGSHLIAANLLLRSGARIWTPMCAFDPAYARYGAGRLLMAECARYAVDHGCDSLELGRGIEQYKFDLRARRYDLTNTVITVAV